MALILFDTNIFIDHLNEFEAAASELAFYHRPGISIITYMELRAGERGEDKDKLDALFESFEIIDMSKAISNEAIIIRKQSLGLLHLDGMLEEPKSKKLPDAIIGATAKILQIPLVTRNPKDFKKYGVKVHVPYDYDPKTQTVTKVHARYKTTASLTVL